MCSHAALTEASLKAFNKLQLQQKEQVRHTSGSNSSSHGGILTMRYPFNFCVKVKGAPLSGPNALLFMSDNDYMHFITGIHLL